MPSIGRDVNKTAEDLTRDLSKMAEDAAYIAIGFGVLGLQRAQVRRRELMKQFEKQFSGLDGTVGDARSELRKTVKEIDHQVEEIFARVDSAFEPVAQRLPATAQAVVNQAREARDQVRHYLVAAVA
jgi:aminoglycoside N3'-acetyltransferase